MVVGFLSYAHGQVRSYAHAEWKATTDFVSTLAKRPPAAANGGASIPGGNVTPAVPTVTAIPASAPTPAVGAASPTGSATVPSYWTLAHKMEARLSHASLAARLAYTLACDPSAVASAAVLTDAALIIDAFRDKGAVPTSGSDLEVKAFVDVSTYGVHWQNGGVGLTQASVEVCAS